jgi:DNA helicase HerA-like ATPase
MSAPESRRPALRPWPPSTPCGSPAKAASTGLYLLLASQRPQKLHPNVVSQCDNLVLMRMSSSADLAYLAEVFSQVPSSLLGRAPHFTIGQALIAGRPVQSPTFVTFGGRLSREGGRDIPATWATGPGRESSGG